MGWTNKLYCKEGIFTFYKLVFYVKSNRRAILLNKRGGTKMRTTLELLRIVVIIGLLGGLGWVVIENIYTINEITQNYSWLGALAILILLFVLYRNKLQFSGWYKGKDRKKLSKKISVTLISLSVVLIITPFILSLLLG